MGEAGQGRLSENATEKYQEVLCDFLLEPFSTKQNVHDPSPSVSASPSVCVSAQQGTHVSGTHVSGCLADAPSPCAGVKDTC